MLVAEHEGVRFKVEPLGRLATLARDRIRPEETDILDDLRPAQPLEHRVDLAHLDRAPERPAGAVRPARDRVEVPVDRPKRIVLEAGWVHARPRPQAAPQEPDILARALSDLARDKVGALIVMRGRDPLDRHVEGGWDLHGELSEALIESIFDSHSLGHDGAMVIEGGRVTHFGVHLPLSKDFSKITHMGLRHTAALGLCERTDALCLVVSQERGVISVGRRGGLTQIDNLQDLHRLLEDFLKDIAPRSPRQNLFGFLTHNTREKALAVGMSALLWWFFVGHHFGQ